MLNLQNKIILITGASSGIGKACANSFAQAGAQLILIARRIERLHELKATLQAEYGTEILCLEIDVTKRGQVQTVINSLPEKWQAVDVLINNAGLAVDFAPIQSGDIDDWEKMIDTNIKGLLYITRTLLPGMIARNNGHIINLGSIAGHDTYPNGVVYCATKSAVKSLSEGLKMDLLGTKIRVSSIDPGLVKTEFSEVRFKGDKTKAERVYQGVTPLKPEDIADAVHYCASRPAHINISDMIILPTDQSSSTLVHRDIN